MEGVALGRLRVGGGEREDSGVQSEGGLRGRKGWRIRSRKGGKEVELGGRKKGGISGVEKGGSQG